jgi:hypothetical protein
MPKRKIRVGGGRRPIPKTARIVVLVDGNPRRPGTRGEKLFKLYRKARTVATFLEKGRKLRGRRNRPWPAGLRDVRYDLEHNWIAVRRA